MKKNLSDLSKECVDNGIRTDKDLIRLLKLKGKDVDLFLMWMAWKESHYFNLGHEEGEEHTKKTLREFIGINE